MTLSGQPDQQATSQQARQALGSKYFQRRDDRLQANTTNRADPSPRASVPIPRCRHSDAS